MKKYLIALLFTFTVVCSVAQTAIGEFRAHVPMNKFFSVAVDEETVYAATSNGLFLLDKTTMNDAEPQVSNWTKVDGLSDIDIVKIHYDNRNKVLIICYENGNIDMIRNDRLVNIRDVKDKSMSGSKRLESCRSFGDLAYFVYPFGIVMIDLKELVITDTWFTKRENRQMMPTDVAVWNQKCYVSTEEGVFSMPLSSPVISDFSQWEKVSDWNVSLMAPNEDGVFAVKEADVQGTNDSLFLFSSGGWSYAGKYSFSISNLMSQNDTLAVCYWDGVELLDAAGERIYEKIGERCLVCITPTGTKMNTIRMLASAFLTERISGWRIMSMAWSGSTGLTTPMVFTRCQVRTLTMLRGWRAKMGLSRWSMVPVKVPRLLRRLTAIPLSACFRTKHGHTTATIS